MTTRPLCLCQSPSVLHSNDAFGCGERQVRLRFNGESVNAAAIKPHRDAEVSLVPFHGSNLPRIARLGVNTRLTLLLLLPIQLLLLLLLLLPLPLLPLLPLLLQLLL